LAGAHLGNLALMQHDAADELHVEVAHPNRAAASLAHHREGVGQNIVQCRAVGQLLLEVGGPLAELFIGQCLHLIFEGIDLIHNRPKRLQFFFIGVTEHLGDEAHLRYQSFVMLILYPMWLFSLSGDATRPISSLCGQCTRRCIRTKRKKSPSPGRLMPLPRSIWAPPYYTMRCPPCRVISPHIQGSPQSWY